MELVIGKDYKGVFGARSAVYNGADSWSFTHYQQTEAGASKTVENFWNNGIFALYGQDDEGFYVEFTCVKPEATKAVLKS